MKRIIIVLLIVLVLLSIFIFGLEYSGNVVFDEEIILPVKVHLIKDDTGALSTDRDVKNIMLTFERANKLWEQGGINFVVEDIVISDVLYEDFNDVFSGDLGYLLGRSDFEIGVINAYFTKYLNANGISYPAQGLFFVGDITTVNDFRTTAHELGHLLGLKHVRDINYLMFKGSNGELLSEDEIEIARKNAKKFYLDSSG